MSERDVTDGVVFIALGTFLATYAVVLVSSDNPGKRLRWFGGRDFAPRRSTVFQTLTFIGISSAVWGGTGLQHHIGIWSAVPIALGPSIVLRAIVVLAHNRRLSRRTSAATTSDDPRSGDHPR